MKRFIPLLVAFVLVVSVVIVSVSASAVNPSVLNNLSFNKQLGKTGVIGYSGDPSYEYCYGYFGSSNIYSVYGCNGNSNTLIFNATISGYGVLIGQCIDSAGVWVVTQYYNSTTSSYEIVVHRYNSNGTLVNRNRLSNMQYSFAGFNGQMICVLSTSGTGVSSFGMVCKERNGDHWGYAFCTWTQGASTIVTLASSLNNSGQYDMNDYWVGYLFPYNTGIVNTLSGNYYGVTDGMGNTGIVPHYYIGVGILGGCSMYYDSHWYYYGTDPTSLNYCQYYFFYDNGKWDCTVHPVVPNFFGGNNSNIEEYPQVFPIQTTFNTGYTCFFYWGSKEVYRWQNQLLPDSENMGNFFDQGRYKNVNITVSGVEVSIDDQFERDHVSREEQRWQEESIISDRMNSMAELYTSEGEYGYNNIYYDASDFPDLGDESQWGLAEFGEHILRNPHGEGNIGFMLMTVSTIGFIMLAVSVIG